MTSDIPKASRIFHPDLVSDFLLGATFVAGLALGAVCACRCSEFLVPLTPGVVCGSVSVITLLLALFLPFILSLAAFYLMPGCLFPVCLCKAFLFSFVHVLVALSFGSAGWLGRWVWLFSDCAVLPLLYFWWRSLLHRTSWFQPFLLIPVFLLGLADYFWIRPLCAVFLS